MNKITILLLSLALLLTGLSLIAEDSAAVSTAGPPGTPTGVAGVGFIDVSWTAAPGSPANYYVYWSTVRGTGPGEGVQVSGSTQGPQTTYHVALGGLPDYPSPLPAHYGLYFQICSHYTSGVDYYSAWAAVPYYSADYPGIPQNLQGSSSDGNAVLTWDASANGGVSLISYHIYRSTSSNTETEITTVSGTTLTYTDTSVAGGQDYYYKVAADNGYLGTLSSEVIVTMPAGKPGTVSNLQAVPGDGMMNLTWSAPLGDGGSAITNYKIYRSTESGAEALIGTTADATRSFQDTSPVLGKTYYYQVTAINSIGESAKCTEVVIAFIQVPTAPRDLQAAVGSGHIELSWTAPLDNGGNPISYYGINRLNVTGGGDWSLWYSWTEGQTFFNDTDVQLGCTYRYSVIAYNDYYEGPESNIVTVNYALAPSEPFNVNLAPGAGTMLVTWNAPNSTGGSPIVAYWVYWGTSPGARTSWASSGLLTSYTITGLTQDLVYYISIAANNSDTRGLYSSQVHAQTPTVPGAVEDLMVIGGDGQVTLGWAPPSFNGRSGITYYCIYRGTSAGSETNFVGNTGSNCTWIDRPLINGHTYYYSVHAHNAVGAGPNTELSIVPATTPGSPTNIHADGGHLQITVTWNQPVSLGGGILHYQIYRGSTWSDATLLTTLGNVTTFIDTVGTNETWSYWVLGQNWAGVGSRSGQATATSFSQPNAPGITAVTFGNGYVNLTWSASSFNGNTPLTAYLVYRSTSPGADVLLSDAGLALFYNDTTAVNGQVYYYVVKASNAYYVGSPSEEVHATPFTVPSVITELDSEAGLRNVTLEWIAPANGGNVIDGYLLEYGTQAEGLTETLVLGNVLRYVVTGLQDNTTYVFALKVHNQQGYGTASEMVVASTFGLPWKTALSVPVTEDGTVQLNWTAPASGGTAIAGYNVYRGETSGEEMLIANNVNGLTYVDDAAINGHTYYYVLRAVNLVGEGLSSDEVSVTPARMPTAPVDLRVEGGIGEIALHWSAPADMGGGIQHYLVYRSLDGDESLLNTIGNVTSYVDDTTEIGIVYRYRVTASNWADEGPLSDQVLNSTVFQPTSPWMFTATADIGYVHLSWASSANEGNSVILGYRIYRAVGDEPMTLLKEVGADPPLTGGLMYRLLAYDDHDVLNGTNYSYAMTSFNIGYESPLSGNATAMPYNVPSVPTGVTVVGGLNNITVHWSVPAHDNGAAVTGYWISFQASAGGEISYIDAGSTVSHLFTGLENATSYSVKILAHNLAGNGSYCDTVSGTTFGPPQAPTVSITSGDGWINVSWSVPSSDMPVLGYMLYRGIAAGELTSFQTLGPVMFFNDSSLVNGQGYTYKVQAFSSLGIGDMSGEISATPSTTAGAPTGLTAVRGNGNVSLSWTAPSNDGGSAIIGYIVYYGLVEGSQTYSVSVAGTSVTLEGLTNGLNYFFRVAAVNVHGNGTVSSDVNAIPTTVPGLPTGLTAIATVGEVALSWAVPSSNGGLTIDGYTVYRGTTAGTMVKIANVTVLNYTDESGVQGIEYVYKVTCHNAEGEGAGVSVSATSLYPPPAPASVSIVRNGNSAVINWTMPVGNASSGSASRFAIYRTDASGQEVQIALINDSEARNYTDTTAPEGTANYRVQAVYGDLVGFKASQSTGAILPAKAAGTDMFLPIVASLALAAILVLFLVAKKRKKEQ